MVFSLGYVTPGPGAVPLSYLRPLRGSKPRKLSKYFLSSPVTYMLDIIYSYAYSGNLKAMFHVSATCLYAAYHNKGMGIRGVTHLALA